MLRRTVLRIPGMVRLALLKALSHDCMNLAQSAAYSAMIALFPALIVAAAALALLPDAAPLRDQVGDFFDQVLPEGVFPLLTSYFSDSPTSKHTARALVLAIIVSLTGASSVISTLLDGLHRALGLAGDYWSFWQRRMRAFLLVPLALLPLAVATVLVIFGQLMTVWVAERLATMVQPAFFGVALAVRWTVSLAGVVGVTAMIYHVGTPTMQRRGWRKVLPGAVAATAMWFATTLLFGWYVTRFANYSQVYGSLGAGIALLLWLYIVFLSVLFGAEFNAQFSRREAR